MGNAISKHRSGAGTVAQRQQRPLRGHGNNLANSKHHPARGTTVDPAQQAPAQRTSSNTTRYHPRLSTLVSRSDPATPNPQYPRQPRHHREQRPPYPAGKLARDNSQRQHISHPSSSPSTGAIPPTKLLRIKLPTDPLNPHSAIRDPHYSPPPRKKIFCQAPPPLAGQ